MHVIQNAIAPESELPAERQIIIEAERRQFLKRRWRGSAADGTEFGFDLASRLTAGCVVFHESGNDYIVRQLPEVVYQVECSDPAQAAIIGWKVGNLHLPAQICGSSIWVLHDPAMTQLLERETWEFSEPEVIFTPMKSMAHAS